MVSDVGSEEANQQGLQFLNAYKTILLYLL